MNDQKIDKIIDCLNNNRELESIRRQIESLTQSIDNHNYLIAAQFLVSLNEKEKTFKEQIHHEIISDIMNNTYKRYSNYKEQE